MSTLVIPQLEPQQKQPSTCRPKDKSKGRPLVWGKVVSLAFIVTLMIGPISLKAQEDPLDSRIRGLKQPLASHGGFTQRVAIEVPSFREIEPHITLDYDSGGGNGIVGVGWQLSGFSAITQRPGEDAFGDIVYMLDNEELVECVHAPTSPGCAAGGTHATKNENYSRIKRESTNRWIVTYPNGRQAIYANRILGYNRWAISEVRDPVGNVVEYSWTCPPGDGASRCYPDAVSYNVTHPVTLRFYYEPRPDPVAYRSSGLGFVPARFTRRLRTVVISVDMSYLRAYQIDYRVSPATNRSLVAAITQYGRDVRLDVAGRIIGGMALLAQTFGYDDTLRPAGNRWMNSTATALPKLFAYQAADNFDTGLRMIDLDGDGLQDLIQVTKSVSLAWLKRAGAWEPNNTYAAGLPSFVQDQVEAGFVVAFTDFNGDGLTDVAADVPGLFGRKVAVYLNTRSGFRYDSSYDLEFESYLFQSAANGTVSPGDFFVDLNGDGRADLLRLAQHEVYLNGVHNPLGFRWLRQDYWANALPTDHLQGVQIADVNGDGLPDILQGVREMVNGSEQNFMGAWLGTGYGFVPAPEFTPPEFLWYVHTKTGDTGVRFVDLNGDGLTDIIRSHRGRNGSSNWVTTQKAWLSTGNGWLSADEWAVGVGFFAYDGCPNGDYGRRLGDINGDGAPDIVQGYRGSVNGGAWTTYQEIQVNRAIRRDIMTSATNGIGGAVSVQYLESTVWPGSRLPLVVPTLSAMTLDDGRGTRSTYSYEYFGARYDGEEQRFLGFARINERLPRFGTAGAGSQTTSYRQDYASATKPSAIETLDQSGRRVSTLVLDYATNGATLPHTSLLSSRCLRSYSQDSSITTCVKYQHDAYANVLLETNLGDVNVSGDDVTTVYAYVLNPTAYIVDCAASVMSHDGPTPSGQLLQRQYFFYDAADDIHRPPTAGLLTRIRTWRGVPDEETETRTEYSPAGDVAAKYDELGNKTEYVRSDGYFVSEIRDPLYGSDLRHTVKIVAWDAVCGVPLRTQDTNGLETVYTHDNYCRRTTTLYPGGGFEKRLYVTLTGGLRSIRTAAPAADGGLSQYVRQYYDGFGRVWKTESRGPQGKTISSQVAYNALGFKVRAVLPHYDTDKVVAYTYDYDVLGRPITLKYPDGSLTKWTYSLLQTTITDERGKQRRIRSDALGRTLEVMELAQGEWRGVRYRYDQANRRVLRTDANGNIAIQSYDAFGHIVVERDPDRGVWLYNYNDTGRLESQVDAKGQRTCFTYDALGRPLSEVSACGEASAVRVSWVYDQGRPGYYNVGHTTSEFSSISDEFNYDAAGNLAARKRTIGEHVFAFGYGYDTGGRRKWTRYPDGSALKWSYDSASRPTSISGVSQGITYTAGGQIAGWHNLNGTTVSYTYTSERQLLSRIQAIHGSRTLEDLSFTYYPGGLVRTVTGPAEFDSWMFEYDDASRLTAGRNPSHSDVYSYDVLGNLTSSAEAGSYTYPATGQPRPHAPLTVHGFSHKYDENGNLVSSRNRLITWDSHNRPVMISDGNRTASFAYDSDGRRFRKIYNGIETLYLGDDSEIREGIIVKHVRIGGQLIATVSGSTVKWLYTDHLGSVRVEEDESGHVIKREAYQPYGARLYGTTSGGPSFAGAEIDETELLFMNSRYYDPVVGQFLSPDSVIPTIWPMGMNRYAYANDDPLIFVDPTGHFSLSSLRHLSWWIGGVRGAISGGVIGSEFGPWGIGGGVFIGFVVGAELNERAAQPGAGFGIKAVNFGFVVGTSALAGYMVGTTALGMNFGAGTASAAIASGTRAAVSSHLAFEGLHMADTSGKAGIAWSLVLASEGLYDGYEGILRTSHSLVTDWKKASDDLGESLSIRSTNALKYIFGMTSENEFLAAQAAAPPLDQSWVNLAHVLAANSEDFAGYYTTAVFWSSAGPGFASVPSPLCDAFERCRKMLK